MKRGIFLLLSFLMIISIYCHSGMEKPAKFITDIPDIKNGKSAMLTGLKASRDSLKLDTLENGFDSLQIRIWLTYKRKDTFQVISLKHCNNSWYGNYCLAAFFPNEHRDSVLYYSKIKRSLQPKIRWQALIDSLVGFNILTLPDCTKLKDYPFPFEGGNSLTFEISTESQYRLYMYQLPSTFKDTFKEAANVDDILKLLSYEFDIKYLGRF
jgi:hypothetical protein